MDDQLVKRFREGEVAAQAAVRNQLRAMATRVLSSPQWQLDAARRQVLEREAAAEAMQSNADSAVALTVAAMAAAAKRGLGWLRKRDGMRNDGHPDLGLIGGVALQTASANQKFHIEKHFEELEKKADAGASLSRMSCSLCCSCAHAVRWRSSERS